MQFQNSIVTAGASANGTSHSFAVNPPIESIKTNTIVADNGMEPLSEKFGRDINKVIDSIPVPVLSAPSEKVKCSVLQKGDIVTIKGKPSEVLEVRQSRTGKKKKTKIVERRAVSL